MRDLHGAEEYLQHAEAALETPPHPEGTRYPPAEARNLRAAIAAGRAINQALQGDAARAILQAHAALDGLDGMDVRSRSLASLGLGLAYLSQGAGSKAADAFRDVAVVNRATYYGLFTVLAAVGEASAHRMAGDLDRALATYDQAIAWSEEHSHPSLLAGSLYTGLADIMRERNELEVALDRATYGLKLSNDLGAARAERWIEWHVCNLLVLARVKQAQGDLDGALAVVQAAQEQLEGFGTISFAAILAAFEAQLRLAQGDLDSAVRWLRSVEAHVAPPRFGLTPQFFVYAYEHLEIVPTQVLLAQGRASGNPAPVRRALTLLDRLREKAERSDVVWLRIKTLTLQALAYQILGEMASALTALEQALAQSAGYIRLFIDEGPPMADLLHQMHTQAVDPDYMAALLSTLEGHPQEGVQRATRPQVGASLALPFTEPLTERELDVLRLLAAGQSNPQIAQTLYVEVNTVKTHLKRLYGKLGVHSRVAAAQRAQQLGFL
jgi:LuxR family maltose regulon positive regulatory protein